MPEVEMLGSRDTIDTCCSFRKRSYWEPK